MNGVRSGTRGTKSLTLADAVATIGENMTLRRAATLSVGKGAIGSYVHNSVIADFGARLVVTSRAIETLQALDHTR